jgi:hypothetical protein
MRHLKIDNQIVPGYTQKGFTGGRIAFRLTDFPNYMPIFCLKQG